MKRSGKPVSKGAEEARQQLPAILDAAAAVKWARPASLLALAGSGRGLWDREGRDSSGAIAALRDEWTR